ncbi:MAG TPA: SAM-dependent chlorinase/fluorinase [Dehalococcoidia bacterium]|nr:SAM-dependent chlorinase/fluorinase [Dehalococcoidia bacterium]
MKAVITLTTDFGSTDAYVASMKGVILGINPEAEPVDICHSIKPQNIPQAAFVLGSVYRYFPKKTVHLVVVDPGVGSERRAIILRVPQGCFVAPDNGVLSYVVQYFLAEPVTEGGAISIKKGLKPGADIDAVHITNPRFWRSPISPTFHGRDILAPVAAALTLGFSPIEFGEPITSVEMLPISIPHKRPDGSLLGHIVYIDGFGNLISDIRSEDLPGEGQAVTVEIKDEIIPGLSLTYAQGNGLLALIGSSGYLEIALKGGSAQSLLDAQVGDEVRLTRRLLNNQ